MAAKPPKLTPELIKEICDNVTLGMMRGAAAMLAGVERETFVDWMRRAEKGAEPYAELRREIAKAELLGQRRLLGAISSAAMSDLRAASWLLQHRHPHDWGERERGDAPRRVVPREDRKAQLQEIRSRYPLLAWENPGEYQKLLGRLLEEHMPQGPTEEHLVEELAIVWWQKDRVRLAEAAAHRRELQQNLSPYHGTVKAALGRVDEEEDGNHPEWVFDAIRTTEEQTKEEIVVFEDVEARARRAFDALSKGGDGAYEKALAALQEETKGWWEETLAKQPKQPEAGKKPYTADVAGLKRFLEREVLPWLSSRGQELESRPLIREQAFGESLDPKDLEKLGRYEALLDRKMERTLAALLRLQELRRARTG